jgi:hypothetical protein
MNDFAFMILIENIRPMARLPAGQAAWFSVVPEAWRRCIVTQTQSLLGIDAARVPFFLTRAVLSAAFVILAVWLAWKASRAVEPAEWLAAAFLTVAWFWLLLPTLNPWYWTWAVPLLPFARNRTWLAVSGLAFAYYFRFWLMHYFPDAPIPGTHYAGPMFFDYVVTWLEFWPWFLVLGAVAVRDKWRMPGDSRMRAVMG